MWFSSRFLASMICAFAFMQQAVSEFTWGDLPKQMAIGYKYPISWSGQIGPVEIYYKKDASPSSWRAWAYEGTGNSVDFLVNATWQDVGLEAGRNYIFQAFDYGNGQTYNSVEIPLYRTPLVKSRVAREARTWKM